jgi:hypothetical protein
MVPLTNVEIGADHRLAHIVCSRLAQSFSYGYLVSKRKRSCKALEVVNVIRAMFYWSSRPQGKPIFNEYKNRLHLFFLARITHSSNLYTLQGLPDSLQSKLIYKRTS